MRRLSSQHPALERAAGDLDEGAIRGQVTQRAGHAGKDGIGRGDLVGTRVAPTWRGDSFLDLICHFEDDPENWTGGGDTAMISGNLFDGTPFKGTDSICIVP